MAFQFNTDAPAESVVSPEVEMLEDMRELGEVKAEIESLIGELPEMDAIYDNLTASMQCLTDAKNKDEVVLMLNIDHSIESLLGVAEDKITAKAAIEGLGDKLKYWWDKFITWVKRVCRNIANFFRKLFGFAPKVSKEAQELADLTGANPEDIQKGLDEVEDVFKFTAHSLSTVMDDPEFKKGFEDGLKMSLDSAGLLSKAQSIQTQSSSDLAKTKSEWEDFLNHSDSLNNQLDDIFAKINHDQEEFAKAQEKSKEKWATLKKRVDNLKGGSTEGLVVIAASVAAVQSNLKAVSKSCATEIPKTSKTLAESAEKVEKIISESQLARMSAKEIEEFYASGGKVEDPLLFKAVCALYQKVSRAATLLHAKLSQCLSKKASVEKQYVDTCKKLIKKAA